MKARKQDVEVKVPVLGDIPVIGWLFKNSQHYSGGSDPNRQDLLIFLTVKLMEEQKSGSQNIASAVSSPK